MGKHIVVVGGVAGGMSCAARIKRLDDASDVTIFERGPDVSFANCGMPYYVGGTIANRADMLVQTAAGLRARYALNVRTRHEVLRIDRDRKEIEVRDLDREETFRQSYDALVLSPGASPIRPPIPGADRPDVYVLNHLGDMDAIAEAAQYAKRVCVVGAGFIGLELVENFRQRGLEVALVEMLDQVLPPLDREMTRPLLQEMVARGVEVHLNDSAASIEAGHVTLKSGTTVACDFVCLCVGVRPNSELARDAGLEIGARGHIRVDAQMRTSDPNIYAVGDAVETHDFVLGDPTATPLAGPANRQGRIAADVLTGLDSAYRNTQGTAIVRVFGLAAAGTGLNERRLKQAGIPYRRVYVHPMQHPRYYPNAQFIGVKLLFGPEGRIYGAQVVGAEGVESLINVLATAMRGGMTVQDLEHLELAYSPQWGGAKHGINMIGFVATNVLTGTVDVIEPDADPADVFWLDCRAPAETEVGMVPGATVIPVDEMRHRMDEIPRDKTIAVYCAVGMRGYVASRLLCQHGFRVKNLNGGFRTWAWFH